MNFHTNNNSHISIPSSSFGGPLPKKEKCFHLKKQAPLSLITNPNAVFVKTKIGEIATFYKEACLKINHNKKLFISVLNMIKTGIIITLGF